MSESTIRNHKDLEVWRKSVELFTETYLLTRSFPPEEIYRLTNQIRRAAVSIPSNIAEGAGRGSNAEFIRFLIKLRADCLSWIHNILSHRT